MDKIDLRYQRGKIYTIRCYDDDKLIYVGSTIQPLCVRMADHRRDKRSSIYQYVNNNFNGNWENWYIELYEEYPCNNKQLLEKREGEITRLIGNINKQIQGRTKKEYYEDNKEIINERIKKYYEDNKEIILEKQKQYKKENYKANKDKILEKQKQKVICDYCGCEVRKDGLKKHQKTKKCIESV